MWETAAKGNVWMGEDSPLTSSHSMEALKESSKEGIQKGQFILIRKIIVAEEKILFIEHILYSRHFPLVIWSCFHKQMLLSLFYKGNQDIRAKRLTQGHNTE